VGKYETLSTTVESVFASSEWTANAIPTFPVNFKPISTPAEFVVVEVLPAQELNTEYGGASQVAGMVIAQIYIPVDKGVRRVFEISDLLDSLLQKRWFDTHLQTGPSTLQVKGNDADNPSLFRGDYSVRF
jgi:hypothetical protein